MMQTTVVAARLPADMAERFREQARRHNLTPSRALEAAVEGSLLAEQQPEADAATSDAGA